MLLIEKVGFTTTITTTIARQCLFAPLDAGDCARWFSMVITMMSALLDNEVKGPADKPAFRDP